VGELARGWYPGGVLIEADRLHLGDAMRFTREALKDKTIPGIYEGAFSFDGVLIRADILERVGNGAWRLVEVKSGASLKEENIYDVALQYYVLSGLGLELEQAGILNVNKNYVYDGEELDLAGLFRFTDLREKVVEIQEEVADSVAELRIFLGNKTPPPIDPSRHCRNPYVCEFSDHCRKSMPQHWIMELSGLRQDRLDKLTERGKYPIHFLDFETMAPAIPRYAHTHPYQMLPFQWSDHILSKEGTLDHKEYLCHEDRDPREEVVRELLEALGEKGSICTYGNYEKQVISGLADHLPSYRYRLRALLPRCRDLWALIRRGYYHPHFHGSFSIKDVLPVLVPSMSYEHLSIQEGGQAGPEYLRMIEPETQPDEKERIRRNLLGYCRLDTLAMVRIREELLKRCRG